MSFWWVNQGKTFEAARKLGALWAPLEDKRGHPKPYWDSLELLNPGDVVFHYAKNKVRAISTVVSPFRIADKRLQEMVQWQRRGREVAVDIQDFDFHITLAEIPLELRVGSGESTFTPFDKDGEVKQGYLFNAPPAVVAFLLERLGLAEQSSQSSVEEQAQQIFGDFPNGTDKAVTGTFRREQRALRAHLVKNRPFTDCGICGRTLPAALLVAAHIKPRSLCSERERVDPNVVMLACVLGCDSLFDKGVIYVEMDGVIKISGKLNETTDLNQVLQGLEGKKADAFSAHSQRYFEWHKKNIAQNQMVITKQKEGRFTHD
jgi:hypothetical protein